MRCGFELFRRRDRRHSALLATPIDDGRSVGKREHAGADINQKARTSVVLSVCSAGAAK
jgi:hypothetical protein